MTSSRHRRVSSPRLARDMAGLATIALALAVVANTLSPARLAWAHDWRHDAWNEALRSGHRPVAVVEAQVLLRSGSVFVADARDSESFAAGHLPGAVPVPWQVARDFLISESHKLARSTPVLVYCSSADCDAALVVADLFREWGYADTLVLVDGLSGWTKAGAAIETGLR